MDKQAVIFDLDGVLVDSSRFHFDAWKRLSQEVAAKQPVTEAWFRRTFGQRNEEILLSLFQRELTQEEVTAFADRKEVLFRQLAHSRLKPLPGARKLVEGLYQAGFQLAVGTSTPPENLEMILGDLGLAQYFPVRITGTDVTHGKPDPEVFLQAAKRLQVLPRQCVVIEDAEAGIDAALRAGMRCIGVAASQSAECLKHSDWIVNSLEEVTPEAIAQLLRAGCLDA